MQGSQLSALLTLRPATLDCLRKSILSKAVDPATLVTSKKVQSPLTSEGVVPVEYIDPKAYLRPQSTHQWLDRGYTRRETADPFTSHPVNNWSQLADLPHHLMEHFGDDKEVLAVLAQHFYVSNPPAEAASKLEKHLLQHFPFSLAHLRMACQRGKNWISYYKINFDGKAPFYKSSLPWMGPNDFNRGQPAPTDSRAANLQKWVDGVTELASEQEAYDQVGSRSSSLCLFGLTWSNSCCSLSLLLLASSLRRMRSEELCDL